MNIKEYISSGILELYALDQLSATERSEVEANLAQYPELKEELLRIEETLFGYIAAFEKAPPAGIEAKIMNQLEDKNPPAAKPPSKKSGGSNSGLLWALGLITLGALAALFFNSQSHQKALSTSENTLQQTITDCAEKDRELQLLRRYFDIANDPSFAPIVMHGTDAYPGFSASIYSAISKRSNFISVKSMPALAANEQFQLWGIVDGTPVSLGVFDVNSEFSNSMVAVQFVENPQAYAVTIEPKGGSEAPTLEKMVVLGNA